MRLSVASNTQNPWERSSRSARSRAAARPSASRTAFWKYTERGVKWAAQPSPPQQGGRHAEVPGRCGHGRRRVGRGADARPHRRDEPSCGLAHRGGEPADPHDRRQLVAGEPVRDPLGAALEVVRDAGDDRAALRGWPGPAQCRRAVAERVADQGQHGVGGRPCGWVAEVGQEAREQMGAYHHRAQLGDGVGEPAVAAPRAGRTHRRGQPARPQALDRDLGGVPRVIRRQVDDVPGHGVDGVGQPRPERCGRCRLATAAGRPSRRARSRSRARRAAGAATRGRRAGNRGARRTAAGRWRRPRCVGRRPPRTPPRIPRRASRSPPPSWSGPRRYRS